MGKYFFILLAIVIFGALVGRYFVGNSDHEVKIKMAANSELIAENKIDKSENKNNINNRYMNYRTETPEEYRAPNRTGPSESKESPSRSRFDIDHGDHIDHGDLNVNFYEGYKVDDGNDDPKTLEINDASASDSQIQIAPAEFSSFHGDKKDRDHLPSVNSLHKKKSAEKSPNSKFSSKKSKAKNR